MYLHLKNIFLIGIGVISNNNSLPTSNKTINRVLSYLHRMRIQNVLTLLSTAINGH